MLTAGSIGNPIVQTVDPQPAGPRGETPYEIVWAERPESEHVQVAFDDLAGWTVAVEGDASISAFASREKRIWRESTLCLTYAGGAKPTTATLRPAQPIPLKGTIDAIRLWVHGGFYRHPGANGDTTVPAVEVLLLDDEGQEIVVDLGQVTHGGWTIAPGELARDKAQAARLPLRFNGLRISGLESPGQSRMYFESLAFFKAQRDPSAYPFRPLNPEATPDLERGMAPTPPPDATGAFERVSAETYRFVSDAASGRVVYEVSPVEGFLAGIRVRSDQNEAWVHPADRGGLLLVQNPAAPVIGDKLQLQLKAEKDQLVADYAGDGLRLRATYRLNGRTLVVDVAVRQGEADGLDLGRVAGLTDGRAVFVPYLAYGRVSHLTTKGPAIAVGADLFVSVLPDLFHSDFSSALNDAELDTPAPFRLFSSTKYTPLTDGKRLPLRDRILITAAPEFHEVLPNPITRPSPNLESLASSMFVMTYGYHRNFYQTLADFGLKNILANHHFLTFVGADADGLASFSNRWRPRPEIGLEKWTAYANEIRSLGYKFGTYSFFPNIHPLSEHWDENRIALRYNGALYPGWWYGEYAMKLNSAAAMVREVGPRVRETYRPDATYLDIHSVIDPAAMDFEAGADGAGLARAAVLANLDAIAEVRKWFGVTTGEGYHRWLYAGASDINFASMLHPASYPSASAVPPLVDFDLLKIHPREAGLMMSFQPHYFLETDGPQVKALLDENGTGQPPAGFYQYVATSLAYGHMVGVGYDYLPPVSRIIQMYALMIAPQRHYLGSQATSIAYHDGSSFLGTSDALRGDAVRRGHLKVEYASGLTMYVNLHAEDMWSVTTEAGDFLLPAYGWVALAGDRVTSASLLIEGRRVDVAHDVDYIYMRSDPTAEPAHLPGFPMRVNGSAWSVRDSDGSWVTWVGDDLGSWTSAVVPGWPRDQTDRFLAKPAQASTAIRVQLDADRLFNHPKTATVSASHGLMTYGQANATETQPFELKLEPEAWIDLAPGYRSYRLTTGP